MQQSRKIILAGVLGAIAIVSIMSMLYFNAFSVSSVQSPTETPNQVNDNSTTQSSEIQDEPVQRKEVVISLLMDYKPSWDVLLEGAERDVEKIHPDLDIKVNPVVLKYEQLRTQTANAISNQSEIDLVALDQIWLGEYVQKGFLSDLTKKSATWGRSPDWYQANWDGGVHQGKVYAVWAWTDIRGIWYWKDLLDQAGVDPSSLKTWDGYIESATKLDAALEAHDIRGAHLVGADYSPDLWYPYLWMQGGEILEQRPGHPVKSTYWYPMYNGTEGVKALEFLQRQVEAGISPQPVPGFGQDHVFVKKKFAVMIEGSWMPEQFALKNRTTLEEEIGFLPMFPVPAEGSANATLMGGWMFGIPETSKNKDLAWEFLVSMLEPEHIAEFAKSGYLPTQVPVGEGRYSGILRETIPYYDSMVSMLATGHQRPNIPEYPQIAEHIRQAIDQVYNGEKTPKAALDEAAKRSAVVLGWDA